MTLADVLPNAPITADEALALFDESPAVEPEFMVGTWRGAEVPTGHPLDGLLAASGWWGKQFLGGESVHPLLFPTADGAGLWAMNPLPAFGGLGLVSRIPLLRNRSHARLITAAKPVLGTTVPKARLRTTRYRGVDSATMIYDQLPINDVFRGLDDDTVLGAMDLRGSPAPYFFVLVRDDSLALRH
ncbi:hypothetical protein MMAD_22860 [Mycolicibacterium madagascariense]|uniref:GXWXG protein n=1 Tax=Mycolicibacterium madagascariense TaxID=212765 RepID=A0A7I7XFP3_9MYCO|nr:DUF4334 domain-containing protein [Mycolicibacterium madagascariense]MCV7013969.1 DUF4334 domain-containing protein [Mycolicibacterium madagascariense]BBZ27991.1 hypothetical protein MMAD_22860 [Mycolicibacterium madagascariense]